ncbi:hypothetical protein QCA50_008702 [Cerrena zonata]|uniref:Uncharacterized protein n=1 Tax=Cerrena zonata TaxID=2478898 RepID=A0AAW0GH71_9APHY
MTYGAVIPIKDIGETSRRAISQFLQETQVANRFPARSLPSPVESKVREVFQSWGLDIPKEKYENRLVAAIQFACWAYEHVSYDFQVAMSLFTVCVLILDDDLIATQTLREFVPRFCTGEPQGAPILDRLIEAVRGLCAFFPDYSANATYASILTYANEELWLNTDAKNLVLRSGSKKYVDFSRNKGGLPEPYAFGIWPKSICADTTEYIQAVPEANTFINGVNDIFSFYKESLAGEANNYIHQYAQAHEKTLEDAIDDLVRNTISSVEKVRDILGEGKAKDAWERFISGYTCYHLYCPRYRLNEVVPEYF